jgi:general secretion pathway protein I
MEVLFLMRYKKQKGLTLIEVLIALAVVSIALTAVIKSSAQSIRATSYLRNKTTALWVGQQVMNSAKAGLIRLSDNAQHEQQSMNMLGQAWYWQLKQETTPNKRIHKIIVSVYEKAADVAEQTSVLDLEGYVYDE